MRRTALVTGAANRIGAGIARRLAAAGYDLHLHTRQAKDDLETLAEHLVDTYDIAVQTACVDFTDPEATTEWVTSLQHHDSPVELVVNNASLFPNHNDHRQDGLLESLAVHLTTPEALIDLVKDCDRGHVINMLDARLCHSDARKMDYELGKHLLTRLTELTAVHHAPTLRVNAIAPGLVLPSPHSTWSDFLRLVAHRSLTQWPTTIDDIADAVLFLDRASSITGQVIYVDSGEHLRAVPALASEVMGH